jgi:hypothetical protein
MRFRMMAAAAAVLSVTLALGTVAPRAEASNPLVLKRFLLGRIAGDGTDKFIATGGRGTQNAYRDNVLMFVFTAPVIIDSTDAAKVRAYIDSNLNTRTIKVGVPAGPGTFIQAEGTFYQYVLKAYDSGSGQFFPRRYYRNRVMFDPTSRPTLFPPPVKPDQNPYGLLTNSLFSVEVPGIDTSPKTVKTVDGKPVLNTFNTTFRTTDKYLQDYKQPSIVSVTAVDAPLIPLDGRTNVDSRADIVATFTEPMLPAAFDPSSSFRVYNASAGRYVTGTIRAAPDGLSFTYRPAYGYGRGPSNIQVTLTAALTDRSNNALDKGITVNFQSEFDPFAASNAETVENFTDKGQEDATYPAIFAKAVWSPTNFPVLQAAFSTAYFEYVISPGPGALQLAYPWWVQPVRCQRVYSPAVMGTTPRSLSGFAWHDSYPSPPRAGVYSSVVIQIGHNVTNTVDQGGTWNNSFSSTPVQVFSGSYTPSNTEGEWRTGPTFSPTWSFNGTNGVVLDIDNRSSGTNANYWRRATSGTAVFYDSINGTTYSTSLFDIRWIYLVDKCEAQSKWYDSGVPAPGWLDPILVQTLPAGTVVSITMQGAKPDPLFPNQPDLTSLTPWTSDPPQDMNGYRFVRFHFEMQSNLTTGEKPVVDTVTMPYVYF